MDTFRFDVAFSFAGPHREKVLAMAKLVAAKLGKERVFYDDWYKAEILGPNMRVLLQRFYYEQSLMVVADLSDEYAGRPWCQAEAEAIDAFRMKIDSARDEAARLRLLNAKFGDGHVPGVLPNTGYLDATTESVDKCAELILERLLLLRIRLGASETSDNVPPQLVTTPNLADAEQPPNRKWHIPGALAILLILMIVILDRRGGQAWVALLKHSGIAFFAAIPFLTYREMITPRLRVELAGYAKAFNIMGALVSTILYSFYAFTAPNKSLLLTNLYWFFGPAAICVLLFFASFLLPTKVGASSQHRWVIFPAMLSYIVVLCIFSVLCTIVLKHKEYYLVGGRVSKNGQPVPNQPVSWKFTPLQSGEEIERLNQTDGAGRYLIALKWTEMPVWESADLNPILMIDVSGAEAYQHPLDKSNQVPWNIQLTPAN